MNLRRVGVLLGKDFLHGSKSFYFIFTIVTPVVLTLVVSLVFGTLFSGKPKLGLVEGSSRLVDLARGMESLVVREYASDTELKEGVAAGAVDMGVVLPPDFDDLVLRGERAKLSAYVWGESLLKDRAILGAAIVALIREMAGQETPVEIIRTTLGDVESVPWEDRLMPFIVLMAVIFGGSMVPASALVEEKQKRTLKALVVTPASLGEVFLSKGLLGAGLSLLVASLILTLNRAFGARPLLLLLVLALGASLAAAFGVLLGALIKDIDSLVATVKAMGILLYAPALVYLFPQVPAWVGRIFPTYYIIGPVVEISQNRAAWPDIAVEVCILAGLIVAMLGGVAIVTRKVGQSEL